VISYVRDFTRVMPSTCRFVRAVSMLRGRVRGITLVW